MKGFTGFKEGQGLWQKEPRKSGEERRGDRNKNKRQRRTVRRNKDEREKKRETFGNEEGSLPVLTCGL